ncbi:beta-1,3-galactosyltransferase 5-like [Heptranchias perlo]|uniref:beta-1,3-galactosyltransferase 5-like n=1 Tax=Heptranchias perlo TaxID=212740 RepID=UPI00355ACB85
MEARNKVYRGLGETNSTRVKGSSEIGWIKQMANVRQCKNGQMSPRKARCHLFSSLSVRLILVWKGVHHSQWIVRKDVDFTSGQLNGFLAIPDSRCDTEPPFLNILVTTRHEQLEQRADIRETWGKERLIGERRICAYFLLGYDGAHQSDIERENHLHKDIIQSNFTDTYYDLTIKVLMSMEWVHRFCSSAVSVMKTDSDMFVKNNYLTKLLSVKNPHNFFSGVVFNNWGPIRNKSSKFYVSEEEYPKHKFACAINKADQHPRHLNRILPELSFRCS